MRRIQLKSIEEVIQALKDYVQENPGTVINPCDLSPNLGYSVYNPDNDDMVLYECPMPSKGLPEPLASYLGTSEGRLRLGDEIARAVN